jgi:signal transduction histidine kinase
LTNKKRFCSLKVKILLLLLVSAAVAVGTYYACGAAGGKIIDDKYLSEEASDARVHNLLGEFQSYVKQNSLTSTDLDKIAGWTMKNGYVNILVFQNGHPRFEAGSWGADSLINSDYAKLYEDTASSYTFSPVIFTDGIFQVALDDFSYVRYYSLVDTVSIIVAACVVVIMMLLYLTRVTNRIKKLSVSAQEIEKGDLESAVPVGGCDELSRLAGCMDNMRLSVSEQIKSESAARKANADLITAISHDIRTPLTTLLGYLELLQDGAYDSDAQRGQYTDAAHDKAMRLKELTDELFSYFLVYDRSEIPTNIEEFDAEILLEQLLGEYLIELRDSGRRVIVNPLKTPCTVVGDVMFLKRVFDNVFSNIGKHSDASKPVVIMAQLEDDGKLHVSVANSIPDVPNKAESTKVGLKTCEKLMAAMGGSFIPLSDGGKFVAEVIIPVKAQGT